MQVPTPVPTPAAELVDRLRPLIEEYRDEADTLRRLPNPLLAGLRSAGAFRLNTPRELGGYELPLVRALEVLEGLSRVDGPTGWVVWNLNFGFSAAFLEPAGVARIWEQSPDPLIANSGSPGLLTETPEGYLLSGEWKMVSGVQAAEWVALVSLVMRDAEQQAGGPPEARVCWVPRSDLIVKDVWHATGMRGTDSNAVTAEQVPVPREMTIPFDVSTRIDRPVYRLPLIHLVFPGCAAVLLGIAQAMIDEVARLVATKQAPDGTTLAHRPSTQAALGRATAQLGAARAYLLATAGVLDAASDEGRPATDAERGELRGAISYVAETARTVLTAMYETASSSALYEPGRIARLFRDGLAAAQHANMSAAHYELAGRTLLGLPPGALFV